MYLRKSKTKYRYSFILVLFNLSFLFGFSFGQEKDYFRNGSYNSSIPTPEEVLGFPIGERPLHHQEVLKYFQILADQSHSSKLLFIGESHEGKSLFNLMVSAEENMDNLDAIQSDIAKLADPRTMQSKAEAQNIINNSPAIAWMMYSVHGNELSGSDAAVQLAYQLIAGTDVLTEKIRNEMVIGIDPMQNPDGRERCLYQIQQWSGNVPNSDVQSILHQGTWPSARGNHYFFDLNRDWFILSQQESRARVKNLVHWNPQLVIDAHEMGSYSTYFFNPPREPINLDIHPRIRQWWIKLSQDQAKAFDEYGWSYYTSDSFDEWYPGYGSSWPYFLGAIAILYEQAGTEGSAIRRPEGKVLSYHESVHHQFASSIANLTTAANNRKKLLTDFYAIKRDALSLQKGEPGAYYLLQGDNASRTNQLVDRLILQGIEIHQAINSFQMENLKSYWDSSSHSKKLPAGTYIIKSAQPLHPLIRTILGYDQRLTNAFLKEERESLEKGEGTRMYEISAWSYPLAYGVESYTSTSIPSVKMKKVIETVKKEGSLINPDPRYGYLINYQDDRSAYALLACFNSGFKIRSAQKSFRIEDRHYPQGTLLLRNHENSDSLRNHIERIARETGVTIVGVNTALSQEGPDLGGSKFSLLTKPKVAVLAGSSISTTSMGTLWYLLDIELGMPHSIIDASRLARTDIRPYNVIILSPAWGGISSYRNLIGKQGIQKLKEWTNQGGTLIAFGDASAFLADSSSALSQVKLKRQILTKMSAYEKAIDEELSVGLTPIDSIAIWEGDPGNSNDVNEEKSSWSKEILIKQDEIQRTFRPRGAMMQLDLNEEHWLAFGLDKKTPAILYTSYAYLAKKPVETAARFSKASQLRLSGLLWPEAKQRWARTCYATREQKENGQIILFAGEPYYRAHHYGTVRLLINGILLGPGLGTREAAPY